MTKDKAPKTSEKKRLANLSPAQITVTGPRRPAKAHRVAALKIDIEMNGQFQPILVVESDTYGTFELIDGLQRLTAIKEARISGIDALIMPQSAAAPLRRYAQIMANVNREDLTKLERAEDLADLKAIWEEMNPAARHGGDRRSANVRMVKEAEAADADQSPVLGLWAELAAKVNLGRTQFFVAIEITKGLSETTKHRIRETWIADHQAGLQALAKVPAHVQEKACDALLSDPPKATSVADALMLAEGRAPQRDEEKNYQRVTATWSRLSTKSKRAFIDQHKREFLDHAKKQGWSI